MITHTFDRPTSISAYCRMEGTGYVGTGYLEIAFKTDSGQIIDANGSVIGMDPDIGPYSIRKSVVLNGKDWTRITIVTGQDDDVEPTDDIIPANIEEIEVRLHGGGTGPIEFDAVQVEENKFVSQYGYIGPSSTVEFEQSATGIYSPDPTGRSWPYPELNHIDLNGASEECNLGFLMLEEFSDSSDEDLECGGIDYTDPTGVPRGVVPRADVYWKFGRRNLPYARLNGRTKLRNRYPLRRENQGYNEPVNPYQVHREPVTMLIIPPENTRRDNDRVLHTPMTPGETLPVSVVIRDAEGNAAIHERVTAWVVGTGSLDATGYYTNDGGRVKVLYTAPTGSAAGESRGGIVFNHELSGLVRTLDIDFV